MIPSERAVPPCVAWESGREGRARTSLAGGDKSLSPMDHLPRYGSGYGKPTLLSVLTERASDGPLVLATLAIGRGGGSGSPIIKAKRDLCLVAPLRAPPFVLWPVAIPDAGLVVYMHRRRKKTGLQRAGRRTMGKRGQSGHLSVRPFGYNLTRKGREQARLGALRRTRAHW